MVEIDWTKLLRAQPFAPLVIHLKDGRSYRVDFPDYVMRTRDLRTILVEVETTGETARFDVRDVACVDVPGTQAGGGAT